MKVFRKVKNFASYVVSSVFSTREKEIVVNFLFDYPSVFSRSLKYRKMFELTQTNLNSFSAWAQMTPHKMNMKVLSVKFFETLEFGICSSKRVEQMSQWTQRPAMDRFWDIWHASDQNYVVNIFIYICTISSLSSKNLSIIMCRKNQPFLGFVPIETFFLLD